MENTDQVVIQQTQEQQIAYSRGVSQHLARVYGLMAMALVVTGFVAYLTSLTQAISNFVFETPFMFFVLIIAEFGLVALLSARINKMTKGEAMTGYFFYALLNGLTLSVIFLHYADTSIATTFFITAGMFTAISLYGITTKKDLSSWGSILIMGVIGLVIAMVVNMFLQNGVMDIIISCVGVVLFSALTAYDAQKIKNYYDGTNNFRVNIMGALSLYLDFINLFLFLLRLFGSRD